MKYVPGSSKCSGRGQRGFSLTECSLAIAITVISVATTLPSFEKMTQRLRVEGTAAQLETDIYYARSLAVSQNQSVRLSFTSTNALTCYVIHTGSAGDCGCNDQGTASCRNGAQAIKTVPFLAGPTVAVRSNSPSMLIDATRGTVTPTATLRVEGYSGQTLHVIVNIMGRVRSCAATPGLPSFPKC
jgi:type IV fimbrial biogenesis protein FimT